jgi:hypothetical protein
MRVLYVAYSHAADHDNADENCIGWCLERLGHTVVRVRERECGDHLPHLLKGEPFDFVLFHKWEEYDVLAALPWPKVNWYFDLISNNDDQTLLSRMEFRRRWYSKVLPLCSLIAFTDGDWVAHDRTGKLRWLTQGCDPRVAGPGKPYEGPPRPPLLFAGMIHHGHRRAAHVAELKARYGDDLEILGDRFGPAFRKHGRELADYMAGRIVIAPDGPCTDRYWSNRVYQALGFGAFLLHPHCRALAEHYHFGQELAVYRGWDELHNQIELYRQHEVQRNFLAAAGLHRTLREHTYKHRVERLVEEVRKVL